MCIHHGVGLHRKPAMREGEYADVGGQELSMSGLGPNISSPCGLQKESVCVGVTLWEMRWREKLYGVLTLCSVSD